MLLQTERLTIRRHCGDDVERLFTILSDPTTMCFWPRPLSLQETQAWIDRSLQSYVQHGFGRYAIELSASGELIGDAGIMLSALDGQQIYDLGYIFHHLSWGQGYAGEAAAALKRYAFTTLWLDTLHANMAWDHIASRRVAEKIGMHYVREFENPRNRGIRTLLYACAASKELCRLSLLPQSL